MKPYVILRLASLTSIKSYTLVGKTDEKVSEHHSPQAGTEAKHPVYFFNYLCMGLHCCVQAFCRSGGYSLVAMKGLLVVVPSLVVEHRL